MDSGLRVAIPGHYDPGGMWCLQRRGIPLTPTRAQCTCCDAVVILPRPIKPNSGPATRFLVTS